ncbi:hypothetical protein PPL_06526 [Heterostelium album PN500]|uniref:F-box domain-containing protein n=1 Tax=Heterostelium pallidum (strain ATCC 26659 / Pp 5 / PN500) TaxID=670386 RepID=D3BDE3_HETP5|nr:hypothetical protein PPL_06526 [Heterostelium album PN500]EFA80587.1 hypothetical protein PPL_06526 [Heterostelium album PN500]|eukprot:XP_020432707.1 hypothetical protein PPL_06526 [Heterostelium album PN500]
MFNNNNNQTNRLVNLSHLLLSKIIKYLDDNIDRIVFTLVCKRWYDERARYLSFNTHHINIINDNNNNYIHLYKSIIIDQINRKTKCKAVAGNQIYQYYYDYLISKDEHGDIDRLKILNIDKISIGLKNSQENKENTKNIFQLISHLNISKLKNVQTFSGLPMNITSMSFYNSFMDELVPGCLPPNLKTLKLSKNFNQPIKSGVLPNTLVKLNFNESFNQPIEPGVLPSSLKVLKFKKSNFKQVIKIGTFPPNLEELEFSGNCTTMEDGALPQTLRILETLSISFSTQDTQMDLNYLPVSLTRLEIFAEIELVNVMPPTIRHLDLENCDYDFNSVFKDRSIYQLDYLMLNPKLAASLDGMKIKQLELNMTALKSDMNRHVDIPFGVETLSIQFASTFQKEIPSSVKKMSTTKECPFCNENITLRVYDRHVIPCYCKYCDSNSLIRDCTCKSCNGSRPHPTSAPLYHYTISSSNITSSATPQSPSSTSQSPVPPLVPVLLPPTSSRTRNDNLKIIGKSCCVCSEKPSAGSSVLPFICIGTFHSIYICKKGHLNTDGSASEVYKFLDNLHQEIINGLHTLTFRIINTESQEPGNEMNCHGISRLIDKTNYVGCATPIDGDPSKRIYIKEKVDGHLKKLHFCNIDHCLRYIILHYVTGKKSAKGTNTQSRSRSLTPDGEDEEEDGEDEDEEEEEEDGEDEETQSTPSCSICRHQEKCCFKAVAKPAAKQAKKSASKRKQSGTKIENVIGDLKNRFDCLRDHQRISNKDGEGLDDHQQRWVICAGIRNKQHIFEFETVV